MNKFATMAAAIAVSTAALTASTGTANAANVWPCNDHWCTKVLRTTGVYQGWVGSPTIWYYLNAGETVMINCHATSTYSAMRPGHIEGWVAGNDLDTGHDPHPNIPYCN